MDIKNDPFSNKTLNQEFGESLDEIDLMEIFKRVIRNKKIVLITCFLSLIYSSYSAFTTKRTWQGEFQIVLENKVSKSQLLRSPELIAALDRSNVGNNNLKTELGILKSPSVLMKIFNFVKEEKLSRKNNSYKQMRFKSWRQSFLDIELEKGTSILNLSYKDTDKDIILPVLKKISEAYQEYSGEKRSREIELSTDYFKRQIKIFNKKITNSFRDMEEFGKKYNLSINSEITNTNDLSNPKINIEVMQDKIYRLEEQLELDRRIYTNKDPIIINKEKLIKFLIKSSKRPEGVLMKYKKLINDVDRNRKSLIELENSLRLINLEKARNKDPWRLVTNPTLLPNPVAPARKSIVFLGGIVGLLAGCLFAIIYEKNKGIIFSIGDLQRFLKSTLIAEIFLQEDSKWDENIYLIINNILIDKKDKIVLLINKELDNSIIKKLEIKFEEFIKSKQLIITNDINGKNEYKSLVSIIQLGVTKESSIKEIKYRTMFKNDYFLGFIILNNFTI